MSKPEEIFSLFFILTENLEILSFKSHLDVSKKSFIKYNGCINTSGCISKVRKFFYKNWLIWLADNLFILWTASFFLLNNRISQIIQVKSFILIDFCLISKLSTILLNWLYKSLYKGWVGLDYSNFLFEYTIIISIIKHHWVDWRE